MGALEIVAAAIVGAGALWSYLQKGRHRRRGWRIMAESGELTQLEEEASGRVLAGRAGDLRVRFSEVTRDRATVTRIAIRGSNANLDDLSLRSETFGTVVEKRLFGGSEVEIGDDAFDGEFFVDGGSAVPLLDGKTREALLELRKDASVEIEEGELRVDLADVLRLEDVLERTIAVARRLMAPTEMPNRLATNARRDPLPFVRYQNLKMLVEQFPLHSAVPAALRAACADPDPDIRLWAAPQAGEKGLAALLDMAEDESDEDAADAIEALGAHLPIDRARTILAHAVKNHRRRTACACLDLLGRSGGPAIVESIVEVLSTDEGEPAVAAARALRTLDVPAAEVALIEALSRDVPGLPAAAAETLGRGGSAAAVLPLQEVAEVATDRQLLRAARQAVAEIQSRLTGASPGQLTLASGDAGQLSMSNDETGRVSLAGDEDVD